MWVVAYKLSHLMIEPHICMRLNPVNTHINTHYITFSDDLIWFVECKRSVYCWNAKIWLDASVVDVIENSNNSIGVEWSVRVISAISASAWLKMFSFWLHCGKVGYELNAKSNLINNIRFNQIYWVICTHTKSHTDVRFVCEFAWYSNLITRMVFG